MSRTKKVIAFCCTLALVSASVIAVRSQSRNEWRYFGGDKAFTRYSALDQINRDNVKQLQVVWLRPAVDDKLKQAFPDLNVGSYLRSTPIFIDGMLYTQDAHGFVSAFDPSTGTTVWQQEPFARTKEEVTGQSTRGVDFWRGGSDQRIIVVRGEYLYALNAKTGKVYPDFGDKGRVSLHFDENQPLAGRFSDSTGPIVVGNVVVITGNTAGAGDGGPKKEAASEDIRGFDVKTGKLLWTFHVVPREGEFGNDTWGNESWKIAGDLGSWNPMTADEQLGYVYIPLTAPTSSSYGGWRPGANLYSEALVALDAKTGKRVWHYQMIHHDLWEYDNVGPATLGDITVNGKRIKAVMQPNKNGYLYVLDRTTGEPVWPIEEKPVGKSNVPGEQASATQPIPTKPPPFDRQGVSEGDLIDYTPELKAAALEFVKPLVLGPLYTPPSLEGTLQRPGQGGGGSWGGAAFDPETGYLIVRAARGVGLNRVGKNDGSDPLVEGAYSNRFVQGGEGISISGLPITSPPYAVLTAVDLNRGEIAWRVPLGAGSEAVRQHPLLKGVTLPDRLGSPNSRGGAMVTKSGLVVIGGGDSYFYAFETRTGREVWRTRIPYPNSANPMTYRTRSGRQFIVVATGSGAENRLIAYTGER